MGKFKCLKCGNVINEFNLCTINGDASEYQGRIVFEPRTVCPICSGDEFTKVKKCQTCGEYSEWGEYCEDCSDNYISFPLFKNVLIDLQQKHDAMRKLRDIIYIDVGKDFDYETTIINLLKNLTHDTEEWIGYWIYELNFGRDAKGTEVKINGKDFPLITIENLWEILN